MPIRYIGILLIFLACTLFGFALSRNVGTKLRNNDGLIFLIRHIRQKIGYFRATPCEIYESFDNRELKQSGFYKVLCEEGFSAAIDRVDCFDLDEGTERAVREYAAQIGTSPLGEQIASCDYILELLETNQKRLCEEYPAKKKVYSSMGMLFGIMAAILLF